ncbi:serine/threonine-protein kinase ULK1 isoform X2 [Amblyraja radiata]|uniref:serine/threonine-protein kinase ULK1 isoform X2 n=1 Tax=Amblyraja radiata TaxID=386614 RepID=UPI001402653A|nr:serine/threonine-protein kinase ULK1 isoform X2 [Amblyraja radiata]
METLGRFEFNRKDLIGHGAFAVVFRGRCTEKHDCEVAIKCINKKNLIKSQTLLGKEIKILKELKHDNIVALYDFQEMANSVYLVMEYCNGGDLADYLQLKGTLSEDTIRLFLQQVVGAMRVLHSKGVIHRDLKPQNILLSHLGGRKANPSNICIKIADFGFARYLQSNMLAATLCGSPMYMAPEVIMSQNYDAKADLWSIGTIVYQCLTGKAPFQANSPQNLRLFYEKNKTLVPNLPRETSTHLRHLLLGLLVRSYKERMDFGEFFHHPFLDVSSSMKKSAPVSVPTISGSVSNSSCSSSSTSHLASPPSLCDVQPPAERSQVSVATEDAGILQLSRDSAASSKNSSCDIDDFVLVPFNCPTHGGSGELQNDGVMGKMVMTSLSDSSWTGGELPGHELPGCESPAVYRATVPIPVPTQIHNYQRMEQKLRSPRQGAPPSADALGRSCSSNAGGSSEAAMTSSSPRHGDHGSSRHRRSASESSKPCSPSPQGTVMPEPSWHGRQVRLHSAPSLLEPPPRWDPVPGHVLQHQQQRRHIRLSPKLSDLIHRSPLPTIAGSPTKISSRLQFPETTGGQSLVTLLAHQGLALAGSPNPPVPEMTNLQRQLDHIQGHGDTETGSFGRSLSAGKMSDLLLRAAFGGPVTGTVSGNSPSTRPAVDTPGLVVLSSGGQVAKGSEFTRCCSPAPTLFTVGSPPSGSTPHADTRTRMFSVGSSAWISSVGSCGPSAGPPGGMCGDSPGLRYSFPETTRASVETAVTFEAPELPEETLMEQEHADTVRNLRFTLAFVHCVMEMGSGHPHPPCTTSQTHVTPAPLQPSAQLVDQISTLRREWSFAEQLVLTMKVAELLSTALHLSKRQITQGRLYPNHTVKQVVRKLNEHYRTCVSLCRSLTLSLHRFFVDKQQLMDRISSIAAEKLIYTHTMHMVQAAALDEMFRQGGQDCRRRYHKALLLMEGLAQILTDHRDVSNITKYKQYIERRLWALHLELCGSEPFPVEQR